MLNTVLNFPSSKWRDKYTIKQPLSTVRVFSLASLRDKIIEIIRDLLGVFMAAVYLG